MMKWLYLSPPLDDAILSCGGLIWDQIQNKESITILTIFAGDPPSTMLSAFAQQLHKRWGLFDQAIEVRRREDKLSCSVLGAKCFHLKNPDCIYRMSKNNEILYSNQRSIFGEIQPDDFRMINVLYNEISPFISTDVQIVCPLALGNHVDHQIVKLVIQSRYNNIWFYADFPYVLKAENPLDGVIRGQSDLHNYPITDMGVSKWIEAISVYKSQISSFWKDVNDMANEVKQYYQKQQGIRLWHLKA